MLVIAGAGVFVAHDQDGAVGMLRAGRAEPSPQVLDNCRISWGRVLTADPLVVSRRPLTWDGRELTLGPPAPCRAAVGLVTGLCPGDW